MLTCDDLHERIPAIEAGEPATGDERDHLASCAHCREEAAAVRDDLERVRQDLATLAPSPFLEDRVREIAAATEAAPGQDMAAVRAPRTTRVAMIAGLAAALLVAGVLVAAHLPQEDDTTPTVAVPSDDGKTPQDGDASDEAAGEAKGPVSTLAWPPTPRQAVVKQGPGPRPQPGRPYTLPARPTAGYAVLGRELLARIALDGSEPEDTPRHIAAVAARLTDHGKRRTTTVRLEHPTTKARVWVDARVDQHYAGTLLVEEPLARAIGLTRGAAPDVVLHEIVQPGSNKVWAQAWATDARVMLVGSASRDGMRRFGAALDATSRVQIRPPGDPHTAEPLWSEGRRSDPRIEAFGETPDMGFEGKELNMHWLHGRWFVAPDRNVPWRKHSPEVGNIPLVMGEVTRAALEFRPSVRNPLCYLVLPTVDVGGDTPVRTPARWRVRLERIRLDGGFTPGAQITVARAWQGHRAIPTRTGVAFTTVGDDGRVSCVVVRGEAGPLRIRERLTDGTVRWHLAPVRRGYQSTEQHMLVVARGRGVITTDRGIFNLAQNTMVVDKPPLVSATRETMAAALRRILKKAADDAGRSAPGGTSTLRLTVVGMPTASWSDTAFILQACAHPEVRIDRLAFASGDPRRTGTIEPEDIDALPYELPKDVGLPRHDPTKPKQAKIKLVLGRFGEWDWWRAHLHDPVRGRDGQTQGASADTLDRALQSMVQRATTSSSPLIIEVIAQPDAPFDKVHKALERVRAQAEDATVLLGAMATGDR